MAAIKIEIEAVMPFFLILITFNSLRRDGWLPPH